MSKFKKGDLVYKEDGTNMTVLEDSDNGITKCMYWKNTLNGRKEIGMVNPAYKNFNTDELFTEEEYKIMLRNKKINDLLDEDS